MESIDIRKTFSELEFANSDNQEITTLAAQEVKTITPIVDENGKPYLMVTFYDDEFCVISSFICDSVKFKNKEL